MKVTFQAFIFCATHCAENERLKDHLILKDQLLQYRIYNIVKFAATSFFLLDAVESEDLSFAQIFPMPFLIELDGTGRFFANADGNKSA